MELFLVSALVVGLIVIVGGVKKMKEDEGKNAHEKMYMHKIKKNALATYLLNCANNEAKGKGNADSKGSRQKQKTQSFIVYS